MDAPLGQGLNRAPDVILEELPAGLGLPRRFDSRRDQHAIDQSYSADVERAVVGLAAAEISDAIIYRRVIIAGDRGRPGEAGAAALRARLQDLAVAAVVWLPPEPWEDWNAWACGGRTPA